MRVLYVGNFTQQHCTEVHLAATLRDLGHEVIEVQENGGDSDWLMGEIARSLPFDLFLFTRTWGNTVTLGHLDELRKRGIPSASYHLDLYVGLQREDGLDSDPFWRTDYVFTPDGDPASAEVFKRKGINHFYMKPGVFRDECYIADQYSDNSAITKDVIFVGGGDRPGSPHVYGHPEWNYRNELVGWLMDTYGDRFTKYGHPHQTVRNDTLNHLYANAKVVVGDSLCLNFDHPYYWSDRVYETMGRGGFIIHPYIEGMEEEFADQQNIVYYKYNDFDGLKKLIDYYLEHDSERELIRRNGHEFVKNNATYHNRLQQMLDTIAANPIEPFTSNNENDLKINIGAGSEPTEGWVNVDWIQQDGIDVVHNLLSYPWPFADGVAAEMKAIDVLEHMPSFTPSGASNPIAFIEEAHRILKTGGKLFITVPHWQSRNLWIDPTHVRGYDEKSMDYFDPDTDFGTWYGYYSECKFKVSAIRTPNDNVEFTMVKR